MGKKAGKVTAKGRLDKFYHLAKEQGYRSRAAYKLIQLNKRFDFLGSARVLVDLCAAPGSWLQVAGKYMPAGSLIMGLDLVAIRPIRNVVTVAQDITEYSKCRAIIKDHLKDKFNHMVDVVTNDGAPNVGANWIRDAFVQSELVLSALRLACEILRPGGWYVTKVFRSQDYNNLLWVFNQFFTKVEAHKPSASRNVSAEIFVVCQGYKAPKKVDPKMFDPKAIFGDLGQAKPMDVLKGNQKRHRTGYEDDMGQGMHKTCSVLHFIDSDEPVEQLASWNEFNFKVVEGEEERLKIVHEHEATDDDLRELCKDLKLLSKTEFKMLLKWRTKMKESFKSIKMDVDEDDEEESDEEELTEEEKKIREEEKMLDEIEGITGEMDARKKRKLKKERAARAKMQRRIDMGMEVGRDAEDPLATAAQQDGLFNLGQIHTDKEGIEDLQAGEYAEPEEEEQEEEQMEDLDYEAQQEEWLQHAHDEYLGRRKKRNKEEEPQDVPYLASNRQPAALEEVADDDDDDEDDEEAEPRRKGNGLLVAKPGSKNKESSASKKAQRFFANDLFDGLDDEERDEQEEAFWEQVNEKRTNGEKGEPGESKVSRATKAAKAEKSVAEEMNKEFEEALKNPGRGTKRKKGDDSDSDDDDWEAEEAAKEAYREERVKLLPKEENALAETLALGQLMLRKKQRSEIVDASYNRYAFNDSEMLPAWFKDEESRHNKPQLPVSRAQMEAMKLQWQAVDARPIKKLAEAKARKKKKKDKAYEKLIQRANAALNAEEGAAIQSEKEKLLKQLVSKNMGKSGTGKIKAIVTGKSGQKRSLGDSKGMRTKVVDKRMRNDTKHEKSAMRRKMKQNHGRMPKSTPSKTKSKKMKRAAELGI